MGFRYGRLDRLHRSADYSRVQGAGRKHRSQHLLLLACPRPRTDSVKDGRGAVAIGRCGLTVSRKVGKAVQRNQVKRWLREILRQVPPPRSGVWDLVLIPHSSALDAGFHLLKDEVAGLFRKVAG